MLLEVAKTRFSGFRDTLPIFFSVKEEKKYVCRLQI
jgi:hypothetical protein